MAHNGEYKRSAGLKALHFRFTFMLVYIQFVQIYYFRPHYVLYNVLCWLSFVRCVGKTYSFAIFALWVGLCELQMCMAIIVNHLLLFQLIAQSRIFHLCCWFQSSLFHFQVNRLKFPF